MEYTVLGSLPISKSKNALHQSDTNKSGSSIDQMSQGEIDRDFTHVTTNQIKTSENNADYLALKQQGTKDMNTSIEEDNKKDSIGFLTNLYFDLENKKEHESQSILGDSNSRTVFSWDTNKNLDKKSENAESEKLDETKTGIPEKRKSSTEYDSNDLGNEYDSDTPSKKRNRLTTEQTSRLNDIFNINPKPDSSTRIELGKELGIDTRKIQIWFQNRRAKHKRENNTSSATMIYSLSSGYPSHTQADINYGFNGQIYNSVNPYGATEYTDYGYLGNQENQFDTEAFIDQRTIPLESSMSYYGVSVGNTNIQHYNNISIDKNSMTNPGMVFQNRVDDLGGGFHDTGNEGLGFSSIQQESGKTIYPNSSLYQKEVSDISGLEKDVNQKSPDNIPNNKRILSKSLLYNNSVNSESLSSKQGFDNNGAALGYHKSLFFNNTEGKSPNHLSVADKEMSVFLPAEQGITSSQIYYGRKFRLEEIMALNSARNIRSKQTIEGLTKDGNSDTSIITEPLASKQFRFDTLANPSFLDSLGGNKDIKHLGDLLEISEEMVSDQGSLSTSQFNSVFEQLNGSQGVSADLNNSKSTGNTTLAGLSENVTSDFSSTLSIINNGTFEDLVKYHGGMAMLRNEASSALEKSVGNSSLELWGNPNQVRRSFQENSNGLVRKTSSFEGGLADKGGIQQPNFKTQVRCVDENMVDLNENVFNALYSDASCIKSINTFLDAKTADTLPFDQQIMSYNLFGLNNNIVDGGFLGIGTFTGSETNGSTVNTMVAEEKGCLGNGSPNNNTTPYTLLGKGLLPTRVDSQQGQHSFDVDNQVLFSIDNNFNGIPRPQDESVFK
ncbi:hypothetical protein BB560_005549 [Smittium megazygosporum]|uniref:Homeobox domain-containing protein n=1 Tax=Smittium megazygosporum TaxID=133381 RepID=A0A2T9Z3J5_9FUNG|nr:hypothetical protein BB560_005549 [Smittium megazygosporum]